jgi:Uma2 family endonuclease
MTNNGPTTQTGETAAKQEVVETELPVIADDLPILYEDEGQENMGDTLPHGDCMDILSMGIAAHLAGRPEHRVLSDMNLYYNHLNKWAYVSPDVMDVVTPQRLPNDLRSYRIGVTGPAPVLTIEVLSRRSFQQQDLTNKPVIYARLGVAEYVLVDVTGEFLPQRLLIKRLQPDQTWFDNQDGDGGVTSVLGFRILIEEDGLPRVIDAKTGKRYLRPSEAQAAADALAEARERIRHLEAELERLRGPQPPKSD